MNKYKEFANDLREAADIIDDVVAAQEDTTLTKEQKDEKEELLLAQFLIKMRKIQNTKL